MTSCYPRRTWSCRVVPTTLGVALFSLGVHRGGFWGLLLMIIGLVPVVLGLADVSVVNEIRDARAHRREQRMTGPVRHEYEM